MQSLTRCAGIFFVLLTCSMDLGQLAFADISGNVIEKEVLSAVSDAHPKDTYHLQFQLDSKNGALLSFKFRTPEGDVPFDASDAIGGVVIFKDKLFNKEVDVLSIQGINFDNYRGGGMRLVYLLNALKSERRSFEFEVIRGAGDEWALYKNDASGRSLFRYMCLKSNKVFPIGPVGIKQIVVNADIAPVVCACK